MLRVENIKLLKNWERYTLLEMMEKGIILSHLDGNHGGLYPKKEEFVGEGIPYLSANCIEKDKINFSKTKFLTPERSATFKKGVAKNDDVLFAHNATVGPVAILKTDLEYVILSTTLTYYRCNKDILLPKYLRLYMISDFFVNQYSEVMRQATRNQVPITKQRTFYHLIPPISDQHKIVATAYKAFVVIDTAKANAEQNLQNAKELFESYLQNVFENKGDNWVSSELNEFVNFIDYRGRTPVKTSSGVRLITAKNIKLGYLQVKPEEFIAEDNYEAWMTRGIPNFGDVIFTTEAPLGHIAQVNTKEKLAFAQRVIVMQPDAKKINQTFLKYLLLSNPIRNKILAQGTGATVLGIKSRLLKKIKIDFPNSIEEQNKIVIKLDTLSVETKKLETIYAQKIADLEEMKKSVLQKAFSGQLNTIN